VLFNSFKFILIFLPVTLIGYFLCARINRTLAYIFLSAASFAFYSAWSFAYGVLLVVQLTANYLIGCRLGIWRASDSSAARTLLTAAIVMNLALLGYFKYTNFFLSTLGGILDVRFVTLNIILPLAISFHTFQQIAFLVDEYRGKAERYTYLEYLLFVLFFPQLIAGPIVHHWQLIPQFQKSTMRFDPGFFATGLTFFVFGLAKKVLLADQLSGIADPVFDGALAEPPGFIAAWTGTLAFGLGLYFDFSAYSDMAIGLSRMFGINLPYNFNSPYQSTSIIDFWNRWHITLSHWLRDYLYIPLGGNRCGRIRRYANLMATMLLGGLWHGASWNFVVWGGLHGLYLIVNHFWRNLRGHDAHVLSRFSAPNWLITLLAVSIAWVFFRSPTFAHSLIVFKAMVGQTYFAGDPLVPIPNSSLALFILAGLIAFTLPNSQTIVDGVEQTAPVRIVLRWRPTPLWAGGLAVLVLFAVTRFNIVRAFVYFQF